MAKDRGGHGSEARGGGGAKRFEHTPAQSGVAKRMRGETDTEHWYSRVNKETKEGAAAERKRASGNLLKRHNEETRAGAAAERKRAAAERKSTLVRKFSNEHGTYETHRAPEGGRETRTISMKGPKPPRGARRGRRYTTP